VEELWEKFVVVYFEFNEELLLGIRTKKLIITKFNNHISLNIKIL